MQKYAWPDKISNKAIKEQFAAAGEVVFSAKKWNHILYRSITFGNLGWWLPLTRVLLLIGITPQMLRPVFNSHRGAGDELPTTIRIYKELGAFPLSEKPFQELARILEKSVRVVREDHKDVYPHPLFVVRPSGETWNRQKRNPESGYTQQRLACHSSRIARAAFSFL